MLYNQPGGITGNAQNLPNNMVPYKAQNLEYLDAQEIAFPIDRPLDAADYTKRFLEKQFGIQIGKAPTYDTVDVTLRLRAVTNNSTGNVRYIRK